MLVPLWRRTQTETESSEELRKSANIALFQERSDEFEAELSAGNIDQQQFDSLLSELQQNLLTDVQADESSQGAANAGKPDRRKKSKAAMSEDSSRKRFGKSFIVPLAMVLLIPLLAYPLYNQWGYIDDVQVMDLFQATVDNEGDPEEAQRLIVSIGQYAQDNPDMPWPFYFLGENFAALGLFEEAQISYTRAAELLEPTAEKALVLGRVATFMYVNSDFQITPEVQLVIDEAQEINPNEISLLQLLAADAEQRQDWEVAISNWRLLIQASPNSEMAQDLRLRISVAQRQLASESGELEGPVLEVQVSLAEGLELDPGLRVFVAARNAEREGMPPLAAMDTTVSELPTTIQLDNLSAVGPFNLSSADSVYVSALVSFAGIATPSSGDYRVLSDSFEHNGESVSVELIISEQIP